MKNIVLVSILVLVTSYSTNLFGQETSKTVLSTDNHVSLVIPASLDTFNLNNAAVLQYGNGSKEIYIIVINDPKIDLIGWNLTKHSYIILGNLIKSLSSPKVTPPKELVIHGFNAVQYEIHGTVNDLNVVYVLTDIETPHVFSQLLSWTLKSHADDNLPVLREVAKSFNDPDVK